MKTKYLVLLLVFNCIAMGNQISNFQSWFDQWRDEHHLTSAVLKIKTGDGKLETFTSGSIQKNGKVPVSANNLFAVGSITKTFVAATLLQLQEEHKLNLDDPLKLYFNEYPRWNEITLRQLLNMTSGIYSYTESKEFKDFQINYPHKIIPAKEMIDLAYKHEDYFQAGQSWHYSNTAYYLLGLVIEKITHKSLAQVFKERFFTPLKLQHSFYSDQFYPDSVLDKMAHGYTKDQDVTNFNPSLYGAAGSMIMNSEDIMAWAYALVTPGLILSQSSIHEMQTTVPIVATPPKPKNAHFGLGIYSLDFPSKGKIWYYAGVLDGYSSAFVWMPSQKKMIVAQIASWPGSEIGLLFPNEKLIQKLED